MKTKISERIKTKGHPIARMLFIVGVKPSFSNGICGTLTCGYGALSTLGYWRWELYLQ